MGILDRFTSIDDLLVELLERIGGVTEEDTHFFSYPNDGSRATITVGTTKLDFMAGTVMNPAGDVAGLGNSLRARGREYCRSLSLQADRDIIIQIGTKSKIPVFAGTWFKVAHLRFTDVKIIAAETTRVFVIACTNPDSIEMAGETYVKDPVDEWGKVSTVGNAELAVRMHSPAMCFERRGDVLRWADFESSTPNFKTETYGTGTGMRSTDTSKQEDFSWKMYVGGHTDRSEVMLGTNDFHHGRIGGVASLAAVDTDWKMRYDVVMYDGTYGWWGRALYAGDTEKLSYLDGSGAYQELAELPRVANITSFSTIKMVVDTNSKKYVRIMAFGNEYDVSDIDMRRIVSGEPPHIEFGARLTGVFATPCTAYIDDLILTENEPI